MIQYIPRLGTQLRTMKAMQLGVKKAEQSRFLNPLIRPLMNHIKCVDVAHSHASLKPKIQQ